MTRGRIIADADSIADAQLKAIRSQNDIGWVAGTFYAGLADYARLSPRGSEYRKAIIGVGENVKWTPEMTGKNPVFADALCIGMAFEEISTDTHEPVNIAPLQGRFDILVDRINQPVEPVEPGKPARRLEWWWCDSLFMAPRGLARMSSITGDQKYIDAMDKEWWRTTALLYDPQEHLFYRDSRYFQKRTKHGKKVFWSRGNGWVIAGLSRVLQVMPATYPARGKYVKLFKEMVEKLASVQGADGAWRTSLLDADEFPTPETSGTSLDCSAIAWGINAGILPREKYLPVVLKAWSAMMTARRSDGLPGYAQAVGAAPAAVKPTGTQLYTSGSYLLTACELIKMAPIDLTPADVPAPFPTPLSAEVTTAPVH